MKLNKANFKGEGVDLNSALQRIETAVEKVYSTRGRYTMTPFYEKDKIVRIDITPVKDTILNGSNHRS